MDHFYSPPYNEDLTSLICSICWVLSTMLLPIKRKYNTILELALRAVMRLTNDRGQWPSFIFTPTRWMVSQTDDDDPFVQLLKVTCPWPENPQCSKDARLLPIHLSCYLLNKMSLWVFFTIFQQSLKIVFLVVKLGATLRCFLRIGAIYAITTVMYRETSPALG